MIEMKKHVEPGKTPAQITVSMIDQDLKDGISKSEMAVKYGIKPWEVDEMFKHPFLKGRRPSRKKALSFTFVDDLEPLDNGTLVAKEEEEFVDPNQVTLEDAIDEAIESVEEAKEELQKTEAAIVDMLSPTETVGNTEYHEDLVNEIKALQSEDEDEIEMDDDTFEL